MVPEARRPPLALALAAHRLAGASGGRRSSEDHQQRAHRLQILLEGLLVLDYGVEGHA
jgi:hypothetical protein